jgi:type I restriction enzyme S subunit
MDQNLTEDGLAASLDSIPSRWRLVRARECFVERVEKSLSGEEELLSVSQFYGVKSTKAVRKTESALLSRAASLVGYKVVMKSDLVVNTMLAWNGSMGVAPIDGIVSPAYAVYRPLQEVDSKFFKYLLTTPLFKGVIRAWSSGIQDSRLRLYPNKFFKITLPVPSAEEQALIVRYLDHAELRIAKAIAAKQRLVSLLDEKRRTELEGKLLGGLFDDVKLKDSGISEVGMIPEHWETPLAQIMFREKTRTPDPLHDGPLSLSQRDGLVRAEDLKERTLRTSSYAAWKQVRVGDLVLNRFKAHLGVFFAAKMQGMVSFHYGVFEPKRAANVRYFEMLFHTAAFRTVFAGRSNGMTVGLQNLSNQNFYSARIVVPPVEEQNEIVAYVDEQTKGIAAAIAAFESEIALLKEYRTRLISDVVTGKLDVREEATKLSEIDPMELATVAVGENGDDEEASDDD